MSHDNFDQRVTKYSFLGEKGNSIDDDDNDSEGFATHQGPTHLSLRQTIFSKPFAILLTILVAFNTLLTFGIVLGVKTTTPRSTDATKSTQSAESTERFSADYMPTFPLITRTFDDTLSFGGKKSKFTDGNWKSLIPRGGGFIPFPDPEAYGMPSDVRQQQNSGASELKIADNISVSNITSSWTQIWGVAVFHQLHCVSMLRNIYWNQRNGIGIPEAQHDHAPHCFDILRQAISCYSDTTLEQAQLRTTHKINGEDETLRASYQSRRQCRDFESIKRWVEEEFRHVIDGS